MIDRAHDLPITKQAEALNISRQRLLPAAAGVGSRPGDHAASRPTASGVPLRRKSDVRGLLVDEGCKIGRRHVKTLMRRMGLEALFRRPRTTKPEPRHKIYPYLLPGVEFIRPNQVWAMVITSIPLARRFVYLAVVPVRDGCAPTCHPSSRAHNHAPFSWAGRSLVTPAIGNRSRMQHPVHHLAHSPSAVRPLRIGWRHHRLIIRPSLRSLG